MSSNKDVSVLFGAPGTGKTTYAIEVVQKALEQGVSPERIAFMSFSRKAAHEARDRAIEKFTDIPGDAFKWFRTFHSAAYRLMELRQNQIMTTHHFKELGQILGMVFHGTYDAHTERVPIDLNQLGDRCLARYARAKARNWSVEEEWRYANEYDLPLVTVQRFAKHLEAYKRDRGIYDFTDILDHVREPLDVDLMIVDEAQDLTPNQWALARRLGARAKTILLAGDDDQAIYGFSGADARPLMTIRGNRIILPRSHRLPRAIKNLADRISSNIKSREAKSFVSREAKGYVTWVREPEDVDLSHGSWLLLCRNRSQLPRLEELARRQNVVYHCDRQWSNDIPSIKAVVAYERIRKGKAITDAEARNVQHFLPKLEIPPGIDVFHDWSQLIWPFPDRPTWIEALQMTTDDREYIRGLRRRNEPLTSKGRVVISTVHGAKGGEADNVLLLTDLSGRVAKNSLQHPDDEWRVAYVGVSRAKEQLFLCQPTKRHFWSIAA